MELCKGCPVSHKLKHYLTGVIVGRVGNALLIVTDSVSALKKDKRIFNDFGIDPTDYLIKANEEGRLFIGNVLRWGVLCNEEE